jgi:hypothetical protein
MSIKQKIFLIQYFFTFFQIYTIYKSIFIPHLTIIVFGYNIKEEAVLNLFEFFQTDILSYSCFIIFVIEYYDLLKVPPFSVSIYHVKFDFFVNHYLISIPLLQSLF